MSAPTHRQLAARHVRRLRTIRKELLSMSEQWDGLDQFNLAELEDLADKVETFALDLVEDGPILGDLQ
mgnify:CR=1 FL=1